MRFVLLATVAVNVLLVTANASAEAEAETAFLETDAFASEANVERDTDAALLEAVATAFLDRRDPEPEPEALPAAKVVTKQPSKNNVYSNCPASCPAPLRAAFAPFASWQLAKDYCAAVAKGTCTDNP